MNRKKIVYSFLILIAVLAFAIGPNSANAIPITGTINVGGGSAVAVGGSGQDGTMWNIATGIDFTSPALVGTTTGDFSIMSFGTLASFTNFTFSPGLAPSPLPLWTATDGSNVASFIMTTVTVTGQTANTLNLTGIGMLSLTNFDSTPGNWTLSLQGTSGTFSYSTTSAVPEPGTIALLGIGLAGLVGVGVRRKMKKNVD